MTKHPANNQQEVRPRSLARLYGGAAVLAILTLPGAAHAAGSIDSTGATIDEAIDKLGTYGPAIGGMYLAFVIASSIISRYQSTSWLAQGRRLAWITGLLGVTGAALQARIAGSTTYVVIAAAGAMAFKLLFPTVAKLETPSVDPGAGTDASPPVAIAEPKPRIARATLVILTLIAIGGPAQLSCGPRSAAVAGTIWDCLAPERAQAVDALTPLAETAILAAASADGRLIDASKLRQATSRATLETEAGVLIQCAMASAIAQFLDPARDGGGSSPLSPDPEMLRQTWAQIAPAGTRFRTRHGTI